MSREDEYRIQQLVGSELSHAFATGYGEGIEVALSALWDRREEAMQLGFTSEAALLDSIASYLKTNHAPKGIVCTPGKEPI